MTKHTFPRITPWFPSVSPRQKSAVLLVGKLGGKCPFWRRPYILKPGVHSGQAWPGCSARGEWEGDGWITSSHESWFSLIIYVSKQGKSLLLWVGGRQGTEIQTRLPRGHQPGAEDPRGSSGPCLWGFQWWCHLHANLKSTGVRRK